MGGGCVGSIYFFAVHLETYINQGNYNT